MTLLEYLNQSGSENFYNSMKIHIYRDKRGNFAAYYESLTDDKHTVLYKLFTNQCFEAYNKESDVREISNFTSDLLHVNPDYTEIKPTKEVVCTLIDAIDIALEDKDNKGGEGSYNQRDWLLHYTRCHLNSLLHRETTFIDGLKMDEETVRADLLQNFKLHLQKPGTTRKSFYCGITNDVDVRLEKHEKDEGGKINKAIAILCKSNDIAFKVENSLGKGPNAFDIGDPTDISRGIESTRFIYIYKK